jgi:hypothetical protein
LRRQANQHQIGKHDGRQTQQQLRVRFQVEQAAGDDQADLSHEHRPGQCDRQQREDRTRQLPGGGSVGVFQFPREERHEGRRKGSFAKEPPRQVGDAEGNRERIHYRAQAEQPRHADVADKSQHATQKCQGADDMQTAKQRD